ncbi:flagellar hook-length control protein FliK [Sphingomonas aliaeris]|uniref:Flagellar hook-length control protein FliK n=1 Tax=Sphingomonas aliaeris TaxID=2759526 RepID=A0A974NUG9_9SPHN|nr:flagellar hook-length control protein FliK [Sphingomonas aliaeris]QQV77018.1 flagellar hook-length control protein FliK [Sphingomonas aliaeris]
MIALSTSVLPPSLTGAIPPVGTAGTGVAALATGFAVDQAKSDFSETLAGLTVAASPSAMAWCDVIVGKPAKPGRAGAAELPDLPVQVPSVASPDDAASALPDMLLPPAAGQDVAVDGKDLPADIATDDATRDMAADTIWLPSALLPTSLPVARTATPPKFAAAPATSVEAAPIASGAVAAAPPATPRAVGTAPVKQDPAAPAIPAVDPAGPEKPVEPIPVAPGTPVADGTPTLPEAATKPGARDASVAVSANPKVAAPAGDRTAPPASPVAVRRGRANQAPAAPTVPDKAVRAQKSPATPMPAAPGVPTIQTLAARQTTKSVPLPASPEVVPAPEVPVGTLDRPIAVAPPLPNSDPASIAATTSPVSAGPVEASPTTTPDIHIPSSNQPLPIKASPGAPVIRVDTTGATPADRVGKTPVAPDIPVVAESAAPPPIRFAPVAEPIAQQIVRDVATNLDPVRIPVTGAVSSPAAPIGATTAPVVTTPVLTTPVVTIPVATEIVGKTDLPSPAAPAATTAQSASQTQAPVSMTTTAAPTTAPTTAQVALPAGQVFAAAIAAVVQQSRRDDREPGDPRAAVAIGATTFDALHANAVAATTDVRQAALDLKQDAGLQGMIDHIEMLRDGADANDTRIRLVPDALGAVDVSVRKDGDRVHVHFAAENRASAQLLSDAQPRLADLAEARGVKLGQTSVDTGTDPNRGQTRQQRAEPAQPIRPARATRTDGSAASDSRIA